MCIRICAAIILAGIVTLAAAAQKANLSGTWQLNVATSYMGGDHPFSDYQLTRKIEQKQDAIAITDVSVHNSVVNIPLPDSTTTMEIATDGKEHEVHLPGMWPGQPPTKEMVTAAWQGGTLELRQVTNGLAIYAKRRLFLSEDGSHLVELVEQHSIYGDLEQRLVYDKAP